MLVYFFLEPILIIDLFLYRRVLSWSQDNTWSLSSVPASWTSSLRISGLKTSGLEFSVAETRVRCLGPAAADDTLLPRQLLECSMMAEAARACGCTARLSAPTLSASPGGTSASRPMASATSAPGLDCHTLHHSFLPVLFYNGLKHQGKTPHCNNNWNKKVESLITYFNKLLKPVEGCKTNV